MGPHSFCGDCHGEWGCHDCPYNTPEAREKFQMELFSKACDHDTAVAKNKKIQKELDKCKELLREARAVLIALNYDNDDFYERIEKLVKAKKRQKRT